MSGLETACAARFIKADVVVADARAESIFRRRNDVLVGALRPGRRAQRHASNGTQNKLRETHNNPQREIGAILQRNAPPLKQWVVYVFRIVNFAKI